MSGGQGGGCRFENPLILLTNFGRPTTCRYHIPYVVAYVVAYVAPSCIFATRRQFFCEIEFTKPENCQIVETKKSTISAKLTARQRHPIFEDSRKSLKCPGMFKNPDCGDYRPRAYQETYRVSNKSSDLGVLLTMKRLSPSLPDKPFLKEGPLWAQSSNRGGYS
jgi:hypothetical protein